ncbi:MAG: ATP-binding protein [Candidatus Coproplasma sp.]
MIKIICGPKGSGKTKQIIQLANSNAANAKGLSVFVTDTDRYVHDVIRDVRFVNVTEYHVTGEEALCGFVMGIMAGNYDIEYVYLDGVARIAGKPLNELAAIFYMLEKISNQSGVVITLTCSCAKEELPDFVAKYC